MANKKAMIHIGASVEAIKEASKSIQKIIETKVADSVKSDALATLATVCNVNETTIANNTFMNRE